MYLLVFTVHCIYTTAISGFWLCMLLLTTVFLHCLLQEFFKFLFVVSEHAYISYCSVTWVILLACPLHWWLNFSDWPRDVCMCIRCFKDIGKFCTNIYTPPTHTQYIQHNLLKDWFNLFGQFISFNYSTVKITYRFYITY